MPATPRWLLAIPDAIQQLEALDRDLLTRRDLEALFGVARARAATLMRDFGAELTGNQRTLPRAQLLRQLRKHRARAAFRGEATRRDRVVTAIRQARLTGICAWGGSKHLAPIGPQATLSGRDPLVLPCCSLLLLLRCSWSGGSVGSSAPGAAARTRWWSAGVTDRAAGARRPAPDYVPLRAS